MNHKVIPIATPASSRQRKREAPKGRRVDPDALATVRELLGETPRRRDLLIEHLHRIQDRFGHLSAAHLAALAQEMRLAQTEVFEVASFYHHFDIVKEGQAAPAALTVRVCDGLSCEMAGAADLLARLPALLGREVRVIAAPCVGRCEQAPAVVVGQNPIAPASVQSVAAAAGAGATRHPAQQTNCIGYEAYRAGGGYRMLQQCHGRRARRRSHHPHAGGFRPARPGRCRLPGRAQVAHRARRARAAADGRQHRRRRARHLQGPRATSSATRTASSKAC